MKVLSVALLLSASVLLSAALSAHNGKIHFEPTNDAEADYQRYLAQFHEGYDPNSDPKQAERKSHFMKQRAKLLAWDAKKAKYTVGLNHFSHWTPEEFNNSLNHRLSDAIPDAVSRFEVSEDESTPMNARQNVGQFSWVDQGAVSSVKNQGQCGCCYTFAAAAALEGAYFIKYGLLYNMSTQQYVECSYQYLVSTSTTTSTTCSSKTGCITTIKVKDNWYANNPSGNGGCNGGTPRACWAYNNMTGSSQRTWECYPFTYAVNTAVGTCQYSNMPCAVNVAVKGYVNVAANESSLLAALSNGPVACGMDASTLQPYSSGVFTGSGCTNNMNHAITVVGYGTDPVGGDYWLIKNSWGPTWGENGFFRLARGSNLCGIALSCAYPVVV